MEQLAHVKLHCIFISNLSQLKEFEHLVYVSLNLNQLRTRIGLLVRSLGSFFVVKAPNFLNSFNDFFVDRLVHEVLVAFGCLHFEGILFISNLLRSALVLLNRALEVVDLQLLFCPDQFKFFLLEFSLLLVLLVLLDKREVVLLHFG